MLQFQNLICDFNGSGGIFFHAVNIMWSFVCRTKLCKMHMTYRPGNMCALPKCKFLEFVWSEVSWHLLAISCCQTKRQAVVQFKYAFRLLNSGNQQIAICFCCPSPCLKVSCLGLLFFEINWFLGKRVNVISIPLGKISYRNIRFTVEFKLNGILHVLDQHN